MIPKIIHYCWLGDDNYSELVLKCMNSWKDVLPDYEFILWDKAKFNIVDIPWVEQSYNVKKYAFAADYIRFYALYHFGGIYLDSDVQVLKSFNNLLDNKSFIGLENTGDFEAAIIGAEKHTAWTFQMLEYYKDRNFIKSNGLYDTKPLPLIIKELMNKDKFNLTNAKFEYFDMIIFPSSFFSPKNIHTNKLLISDETYTIHHFDGQWVNKSTLNIIKEKIHKLLLKFFGQKIHYKMISIVRFFNRINE
jgi:mannosyltransferase OCH1-like enzyme